MAPTVHWGNTWATVEQTGPDLRRLIAWISRQKGKDEGGAVVVRGLSSSTIRHLAERAAQSQMSAPAALPDPRVAGTFYFQQQDSSGKFTEGVLDVATMTLRLAEARARVYGCARG